MREIKPIFRSGFMAINTTGNIIRPCLPAGKNGRETIENMTNNHQENGIEYIISEVNGQFTGILAYKKNRIQGFELYLPAVDREKRKKGIGQDLINECVKVASEESFRNIDSFVFADNKDMLRLLIKNDFRPVEVQYHVIADGMDLIKLRKSPD